MIMVGGKLIHHMPSIFHQVHRASTNFCHCYGNLVCEKRPAWHSPATVQQESQLDPQPRYFEKYRVTPPMSIPTPFSQPQSITQNGVHIDLLTAREREHWFLQHFSLQEF